MGVNGGSSNAGINGSGGSGGSDIYYSTPAEMMEHISSRGPSRILNEDGVFVTRETYNSQSSLESNQGVRPRLGESTSLLKILNIIMPRGIEILALIRG